MASPKPDASSESSKKAKDEFQHTVPLFGDLSELLEQVEEMYKAFIGSPKVVPNDSESRTVEREKGKENSGSGEGTRTFKPLSKLPGLKCMRKILHSPTYKCGDRLSPEDELNVRSVFQYHPKVEEKTGPGIDHIKIDRIYDEVTRCFWIVRTDGTAIDFSYHKCLQARAASESPSLNRHDVEDE